VLFRGEIDDVPWVCDASNLINEDPPDFQTSSVEFPLVGLKVVWKCFLKLEGNTFTHDSYRVDSVHQGLNVRL
jgi:hypothetical protein